MCYYKYVINKSEKGKIKVAKLYFKYGVMGCSKSAQALMCKYNYEQKNFKVLLIKPAIDNRDDTESERFVTSGIGLKSPCFAFPENLNLKDYITNEIETNGYQVVIVDEAQFCTTKQVEQLKEISRLVPVLCYGLKNNFKSYLFEGSKRLIEIADSLMEIKSVCSCGRKADINARHINGKIITDGEEVVIGGSDMYESMCYNCWISKQNK